jgi:DDE superfamily endonuclease
MSALTKSSSKRKRDATSLDEHPDWESMLDELGLSPAHGAITRVALHHGVSPRRLNRRWSIYRDAVQANDVATQHAMRGYHDRRRDNRLAVPRDVERRTIDSLLLTNPSPSRADVSAALVQAHRALPTMQRPSRNLPRFHSSYRASSSTVQRVLRQQRIVDKKLKLERTRVKEPTEKEKADKLDECLRYLDDIEAACLTHGRDMVINVDETAVRTIRPRSHALARRGDWKHNRPVMKVTRSDRESTSLVCAVAADGTKLRPCVLSSRRTEAALRRDNRWEAITCGGWTNEAVYMEYIWRVILPYTAGRPATIVHDSLTTHHTDDVLSFLLSHNLFPIDIPAGQTATLQPLDVGVFGPIKATAKQHWNEEKQKDRVRVDTQHLSMSLHVEAFTQLSRSTVKKAWAEAVPALAVKPTRCSR